MCCKGCMCDAGYEPCIMPARTLKTERYQYSEYCWTLLCGTAALAVRFARLKATVALVEAQSIMASKLHTCSTDQECRSVGVCDSHRDKWDLEHLRARRQVQLGVGGPRVGGAALQRGNSTNNMPGTHQVPRLVFKCIHAMMRACMHSLACRSTCHNRHANLPSMPHAASIGNVGHAQPTMGSGGSSKPTWYSKYTSPARELLTTYEG